MSESRKRSVAKSFTWRLWGIVMSLSIGWFLTKDMTISLWFMFWTNLSGFVCYIIHERVWGKVKWGMIEDVIHQVIRKDNPIFNRRRDKIVDFSKGVRGKVRGSFGRTDTATCYDRMHCYHCYPSDLNKGNGKCIH